MGFGVFGVVGVVVGEVTFGAIVEVDDEDVDEEGRASVVLREPERAEERREDKPAREIEQISKSLFKKNKHMSV